MDRTKPKSH